MNRTISALLLTTTIIYMAILKLYIFILPPDFKQQFRIPLFFIFLLLGVVLCFYIHRTITCSMKLWRHNTEKYRVILENILEISDSILSIENMPQVFQMILEKAVASIDTAEMGSLLILNENNELKYEALVGYDAERFKGITLKLEDSFLYKFNNGAIKEACVVKDIEEFDRINMTQDNYDKMHSANAFSTKSAISAPIIIHNKLYGMINVDSKEINSFTDLDKSFMEYFANQVSTVIKSHELLDKTIYLSRHDNLTGTYNRYYLHEVLSNLSNRAEKQKETFSIVLFDLDNLKINNDTFGHHVGDTLIHHFAQGLKQNTRKTDIIARYGGDEFVGAFPNTKQKDVQKIIKKLKTYFSNHPICGEITSIFNEFSYGIVHYPTDGEDLHTLLKIADDRMYLHKQSQKNSITSGPRH